MIARLLLAGSCALGLAACDASSARPDGAARATPPSTASPAAPAGSCAVGKDLPQQPAVVGLSEAEAVERGRREGLQVRTVCRDGVGLDVTSDYVPGRINLVVEDGQVVRADEE